jgi:hypothetical protein
MNGGSRETRRLYSSLTKLLKVVDTSNRLFFAGNLSRASDAMLDAMKLFRKLSDEKSIGVACNNLGNIQVARLLESSPTPEMTRQPSNPLTWQSAIALYDEAVDIARLAADAVESDDHRIEFLGILASRLFNRGVSLLLLDKEISIPTDARNQGLNDLQTVRNLCTRMTELVVLRDSLKETSLWTFESMLQRLHGLSALTECDGVQDIWNGNVVANEAFDMLRLLWSEQHVPLFEDIDRHGRYQQVEAALVAYEGSQGCSSAAIRRSIRMFAEDEYLLDIAFAETASILVAALSSTNISDQTRGWLSVEARSHFLSDIAAMAEACTPVSIAFGKNLVMAISITAARHGEPVREIICSKSLEWYNESCGKMDYFGVLNSRGETRTLLAKEGDLETGARNQKSIAEAVRVACESPPTIKAVESHHSVLLKSLRMISDTRGATCRESFVVLVTDGDSWTTEDYLAVRAEIETRRTRKESSFHTHLLVIGIDIRSGRTKGECGALCGCFSTRSMFLESPSSYALSSAFDKAVTVWHQSERDERIGSRGGRRSAVVSRCSKWMAMEHF